MQTAGPACENEACDGITSWRRRLAAIVALLYDVKYFQARRMSRPTSRKPKCDHAASHSQHVRGCFRNRRFRPPGFDRAADMGKWRHGAPRIRRLSRGVRAQPRRGLAVLYGKAPG